MTETKKSKTPKAAKPAAKPAKAPRERKLRGAQVRALQVLNRVKNPLTKQQIEVKAQIQPNWTLDMLGRLDAAVEARAEEQYKLASLRKLGYVSVSEVRVDAEGKPDQDGRKSLAFQITAAGKAALATLPKK